MRKFFFILTIFLLFIPVKKVSAQSFETEYSVIYEINKNGVANIKQDTSITNKENSVFATNYTLTIKKMHVYDVQGTDRKGKLDINVESLSDSSVINVLFNDQVVGEGRNLQWNLEYKTKDIATNVGSVWNINIPKTQTLDNVKEYNVKLIVPKSLGPKIFISPTPVEEKEDDNFFNFSFSKNSLISSGIAASFGSYQTFNFKLDYHLNNQSNFSSYQNIALPPDVAKRQQVYYKQLSPKPQEIRVDKDGNYLATYKLKPKTDLRITLIGSARILGKQISPEFGGRTSEIPKALLRKYTKQEKFWESDSKSVQTIKDKLYRKDATVSQNAQAIYNYVINNLEYDFELSKRTAVERKGAIKAIAENEAGTCMEFTDLFIALARSAKIPAREIDGYAYAREENLTPLSINLKSGDFLHAWPEYYDPNFGWVSVDPTWGKTSGLDYFTKLDTNHLAFVIKGKSPEYPLPAGEYKILENEKQVEVDFAIEPDVNVNYEPKLVLYKTLNTNPVKFLTGKSKFMVVNEGNASAFAIADSKGTIPPFGKKAVYLPKKDSNLQITDFNGELHIRNFPVREGDFSFLAGIIFLIVLVLGLCMIFYLAINQPKSLKILIHRLRSRPQARDQ